MKAIQITMDETLLAEFDADSDVRKSGRSAVLRRMAAEYLIRKKCDSISTKYKQAYSETADLREELAVWEEEGVWPTE